MPWEVVDRLIVFGERVVDPITGDERLKYPSLASLAERYGVTRTLVWKYAHKARCFDRRIEARLKAQARSDDMVIEKIANATAKSTVDVAAIVDVFIARFHRSLDEGKVRADSPADLDRLVRLKELLRGGADARVELQGGLTLEAIQARHRVLRSQVAQMTPMAAGTIADPNDSQGVERPGTHPDAGELGRELDGDPSSGQASETTDEAMRSDEDACGSSTGASVDDDLDHTELADENVSAAGARAAGGVR